MRAGTAALALLLPAVVFAEEWFDAYARGLEALRQRNGPKAVEYLERAIRKRPEPGENLITYGTNRLERYHPYLRLAQAYLLVGDLEKAREALRRSQQRGKEPAEERRRIVSVLEAAAEQARAQTVAPTPAPPSSPAAPRAATAPAPSPTAAAPISTPALASSPAEAPPLPPVAAPATGVLDLRSEPEGATVLLGARFLGTTPLEVELAPGDYRVSLRKEGNADQTFPVRIEAGRRWAETRALVAAGPSPAQSLAVTAAAPGSSASPLALPPQPPRASPPAVPVSRLRLPRRAALAILAVLILGVAALRSVRRRSATVAGETVALSKAETPAATPSRTSVSPTTASTDLTLERLETRPLPAATAIGGMKDQFGPYRLLEPLGKGGMAAVFKAERGSEVCALKRPLPAFLEDPEFLERFLREAEIGRTLHHPNIIRIFERGEVDGVPYLTMELVQGQTLQARIKKHGAMAPKAAAEVIVQVAEALDYAHLKGVIHRDLKPSNVMLLEDGTVKVMDYGIARARRFEGITVTGAFLGTPDYVAPETAEGKGTDARSDLYSLGIIFYEILTGKRPFMGDSPFATLRKHVSEPPTPPSLVSPGVPRELEAMILKLLRKDPAERYPGAEELLIELRAYLNRAA